MYLFLYSVGLLYVILCIQNAENSIVVCDLSNRDTSCHAGHCCVRDEFILEDVLCKPYGKVNDVCTTITSESECPCLKGLYCRPMIETGGFRSIYGHCHNLTIDKMPTTTTAKPDHPPVIHFVNSSVDISHNAPLGQSVANFTVTDPDNGTYGDISCEIFHSDYFQIKKDGRHKFEIVVSSSITALSSQTLLTFIDCKDAANTAANNIASLVIRISNEIDTLQPTDSSPEG